MRAFIAFVIAALLGLIATLPTPTPPPKADTLLDEAEQCILAYHDYRCSPRVEAELEEILFEQGLLGECETDMQCETWYYDALDELIARLRYQGGELQ